MEKLRPGGILKASERQAPQETEISTSLFCAFEGA
jgi:hypothetical protein